MSVAKFSFLLSGSMRLPAAVQVAATRNFWMTAVASEPARHSISIKLPERPKRPLSPYIQFAKQNGKSLSGTVAENAKELGRQWKEMDEAARRPFVALFEAEQLEYHKNMDKLMAKLEKSGKLEMFHAKEDVARSETAIRRLKRKINKLEVEMDIPKRAPISGYALFVAEETAGGGKASTQLPAIAQKWNAMSKEQKMVYDDKLKAVKVERDSRMAAWVKKNKDTPEMSELEDALSKLKVAKSKKREANSLL